MINEAVNNWPHAVRSLLLHQVTQGPWYAFAPSPTQTAWTVNTVLHDDVGTEPGCQPQTVPTQCRCSAQWADFTQPWPWHLEAAADAHQQ
jgi:hypothetical protein